MGKDFLMDSKKKYSLDKKKRQHFLSTRGKKKIFMNNTVAASVRPRSSNNIREIQLIHPQTGGKETKNRTVLQCCINANNKKKVMALPEWLFMQTLISSRGGATATLSGVKWNY